jgi:hypothetical protein
MILRQNTFRMVENVRYGNANPLSVDYGGLGWLLTRELAVMVVARE